MRRAAAFILLSAGLLVVVWLRAARADPPAEGRAKVTQAARPPVRPLVTISKETTFITEPLRPDGYPNYLAAINAKYGEGVTPENNAVVLLYQAIGPRYVPPDLRDAFFKQLGIARLADEGPYFVSLFDFVRKWKEDHPEAAQQALRPRPPAQPNDAAKAPVDKPGLVGLLDALNTDDLPYELEDQLEDDLERVQHQLWSAEEYPILAAWLEANEKSLSLVTEASRRPKMFTPLVAVGDASLIGAAVNVSVMTGARNTTRALIARSTLRAASGKIDEAWDDCLTCYRLARLIGQAPFLFDALLQNALDASAARAALTITSQSRITKNQAVYFQNDLDKLASWSPIAGKFADGERLFGLDAACAAARNSPEAIQGYGIAFGGYRHYSFWEKVLLQVALDILVDWDEALRTLNGAYDRMVAASRKPSRKLRDAEYDANENGARTFEVDICTWPYYLKFALGGRATRGEMLGKACGALIIPALTTVARLEDRSAAYAQLTQIAFALAAYRSEWDRYPDKLAELVPVYIKELPKDLFSDIDFIYQPQEDGGYLLYSVGPNGKDDGGRDRESDPDSQFDDLVVRTPQRK